MCEKLFHNCENLFREDWGNIAPWVLATGFHLEFIFLRNQSSPSWRVFPCGASLVNWHQVCSINPCYSFFSSLRNRAKGAFRVILPDPPGHDMGSMGIPNAPPAGKPSGKQGNP